MVKKRRTDLCLQSTPFVRCSFPPTTGSLVMSDLLYSAKHCGCRRWEQGLSNCRCNFALQQGIIFLGSLWAILHPMFRCIFPQETMRLNLTMEEWTLLATRTTGRLFSGEKATRYIFISRWSSNETGLWHFCLKVGLQLGVIPREGGKVVVGFGIQYQYTNTVFALGIYQHILFITQLLLWKMYKY